MIQANELRIGNWAYGVMYPNQPLQIKTIHENIVHLGEHINGYDSLEPIPLTPEILEKCGFEKKQWTTKGIEITCHYYQLNNIVVYLLKGFFEIELITKAGQFNMSKSWNYLHQLQNLYWCLCGKELIFKP